MIIRRKISRFAIFIVSVTSIFAFQCPEENEGCSCWDYSGKLEIECQLANNSIFNVNIQPGHHIKIECYNSPKWSEFHLKITPLEINNVKMMQFRMCDLPPSNMSLGEITQMLGANGVEKLIFQSFKDLSSTFKKHYLDGFDNLKSLILSSNHISYLDEDLLANVPNLVELNLLENNVHLPDGFFKYIPNLRFLELSDNNLQTLKLDTFDNLKKLTLLNLWKNNLNELQLGLFDKLVTLRSLDINTNDIIDLPEHIFTELKNLEVINLSRNNFKQLPMNLLRNNTKLHTANLKDNKGNMTTLPNGFFSNLIELKVLNLKQNKFITLPEDLVWGSSSLIYISLMQNRLKTLPKLIFRDSKQLEKLELSFNQLEQLPDYVFLNTKIKILDLSANRLTSISKFLFNGLDNLEELNMEKNQLTTISTGSFSSLIHLKIARFSNNRLTLKSTSLDFPSIFGVTSPFHDCIVLEELYLANNNISEIFDDWIVSNLKLRILDLKYNDIASITTADLQFVSSKIKVDLTHNKIQHILLKDADSLANLQRFPRDVIIRVENNPLVCSCNLYDFLRYIEGRMHPTIQNYFHIIPGNLTCQSPAWLENVNVVDLKSRSLTCLAKDTNLNITGFEKCDCIIRPEDNAFIADCSHKNLIRVPKIWMNLNHLMRIELNFSGNGLTQMPNLKKLGLESAKKLDFSHNNILEISTDGLSDAIEILQLHNNNISRIRPNVLESLKSLNLTRLTLQGNPWECDCDAKDFLNFIQTKFVKIPELLQVTCREDSRLISEMTAIDFCPFETELIIGLSFTIAFVGLFFGLVLALGYKYQKEIKVWLFAHQWCLWFVTEEELDRDKLYDAFVSYSHKDHDFVVNELVSKLEDGPKQFKLCLHYRDWLAGEWIPAQIARSVQSSRRTIVVLTPNFLESVWGRMEFRAAHSQALSEGRARVILILYGDIGPTEDLDAELQAYLSMNTYIKWGDPWFWDKLRYALPHMPKEFTKNTMAHKIFQNHQLCIQMKGDKEDLIYPVGVTEILPADTTPPADTLKTFTCDKKSEERLSTSEYLQDVPKTNSNIAIIFEPDNLVKRDYYIISNTQSTTVC